jgi:hypothetical protein
MDTRKTEGNIGKVEVWNKLAKVQLRAPAAGLWCGDGGEKRRNFVQIKYLTS